jgi:hypothetical protein
LPVKSFRVQAHDQEPLNVTYKQKAMDNIIPKESQVQNKFKPT